jgi:hypothetical protein
MSQLGFFTDYDIRGSDVLFCAHNWVGLALNQDNAMCVTILHCAHLEDASPEKAAAIVGCSDMYDFSWIKGDAEGYEARFELPDRSFIFRCNAISYGTRYYTAQEIDALVGNLANHANVSDAERAQHHAAVEARKHLIVKDRFHISVASCGPVLDR